MKCSDVRRSFIQVLFTTKPALAIIEMDICATRFACCRRLSVSVGTKRKVVHSMLLGRRCQLIAIPGARDGSTRCGAKRTGHQYIVQSCSSAQVLRFLLFLSSKSEGKKNEEKLQGQVE